MKISLNNLKQERKHLIIVKQYHKVDFESNFVQGKKIIKQTQRKKKGA